jgi:hypothetical protein
MLLHQLLDFSPAVTRRRFDPMVGVLSVQDPRDDVQLGPAAQVMPDLTIAS